MKKKFCVAYRPIGVLKLSKEELIKEVSNIGYEYDEINPDVVISLGGDGTMLRATHRYFKLNPLFIGINEGNLGFLCQFATTDLNKVLNILKNNDFNNLHSYRLLKLEGVNEEILSLNEIRVHSIGGGTLKFDVYVNDEYLETLMSDGICFSSNIGSSAINKNLGGALIDPQLDVIQLCEITAINNKFYSSLRSPLILNSNSKITLKNFSREQFIIYYDSNSYEVNDKDVELNITLSNEKISVLRNTDSNYIKKLNDSFIK